jgi:hypothetical protein
MKSFDPKKNYLPFEKAEINQKEDFNDRRRSRAKLIFVSSRIKFNISICGCCVGQL